MFARIVLALTSLTNTAFAYEPAGTPPDWPPPMPATQRYGKLLADRLETRFGDDADSYAWDIQGWYGGDRNRLSIKTEGGGEQGDGPQEAELQLLFSRLIAPYWEWQFGLRHDFDPDPQRSYLVAGLQGIAPYEVEIDAALFISDEGDVSVRFEAEHDLRITQRLVVQPRLELNAAFTTDRDIGRGGGVNDSELGLRLRYEVRREFAPYIGVAFERLYGRSADFARGGNKPTSVTALVAGFRLWF